MYHPNAPFAHPYDAPQYHAPHPGQQLAAIHETMRAMGAAVNDLARQVRQVQEGSRSDVRTLACKLDSLNRFVMSKHYKPEDPEAQATLAADMERETARLQALHADQLRKAVNERNELFRAQLAELREQAEVDAHRRLAELRQAHDLEIQRLRDEHAAALAQAPDEALRRIQQEHAVEAAMHRRTVQTMREDHQAELAGATDELEQARRDLRKAEMTVSAQAKELQALKNQLQQADARAEGLQDQLQQADARAEGLQDQLQQADARAAELQALLDRREEPAPSKKAEKKKRAEEAQAKYKAEQKELEDALKSIQQAQDEEARKRAAAQEAQIAQLKWDMQQAKLSFQKEIKAMKDEHVQKAAALSAKEKALLAEEKRLKAADQKLQEMFRDYARDHAKEVGDVKAPPRLFK